METWSDFYKLQYPKLEDSSFERLRRIYDPKGIFLTNYWQNVLGINREYTHDEQSNDGHVNAVNKAKSVPVFVINDDDRKQEITDFMD